MRFFTAPLQLFSDVLYELALAIDLVIIVIDNQEES